MGIDANRFLGKIHEQFVCPVCLDVLEDPVETPCQHLFCKACLDQSKRSRRKSCPTCRQPFVDPKPINRNLKSIYDSLTLSCRAPGCREKITISTFKKHDETCPLLVYVCSSCSSRQPSEAAKSSSCQACCNKLKDTNRQMLEKLNEAEAKIKLMQFRENTTQMKIKEMEAKILSLESAVIKTTPTIVAQPVAIRTDTAKSLFKGLAKPRLVHRSFFPSSHQGPITSPFSATMCKKMIAKGENYHICHTCAKYFLVNFCHDCFIRGNHAGHNFSTVTNHWDNCQCNCGDGKISKDHGYCTSHMPLFSLKM